MKDLLQEQHLEENPSKNDQLLYYFEFMCFMLILLQTNNDSNQSNKLQWKRFILFINCLNETKLYCVKIYKCLKHYETIEIYRLSD